MKLKKALRIAVAAVVLLAAICLPGMAKTLEKGVDFFYLDNADVLSEALEGEIYFANKLLEDACGAQIVVVTVANSGSKALDDYAYDVFNDWEIGDASKNNGFLLILAIGDEDYYALAGTGLRSKFSASVIKEYYDEYLEQDFAAGRYEEGVKKFFEAALERICTIYEVNVTPEQAIADYEAYVSANAYDGSYGGYMPTQRETGRLSGSQRSSRGGTGFGVFVFIILIVVVLVLVSSSRRRRRNPGLFPPPPPVPPDVFIGPRYGSRPAGQGGYRSSGWSQPRSSGWFSGSSSRSFGSSSSSSFGSSSSRSFGSSSRSSSRSFGGGRGGGGRSSGGGAGRGRH